MRYWAERETGEWIESNSVPLEIHKYHGRIFVNEFIAFVFDTMQFVLIAVHDFLTGIVYQGGIV